MTLLAAQRGKVRAKQGVQEEGAGKESRGCPKPPLSPLHF